MSSLSWMSSQELVERVEGLREEWKCLEVDVPVWSAIAVQVDCSERILRREIRVPISNNLARFSSYLSSSYI